MAVDVKSGEIRGFRQMISNDQSTRFDPAAIGSPRITEPATASWRHHLPAPDVRRDGLDKIGQPRAATLHGDATRNGIVAHPCYTGGKRNRLDRAYLFGLNTILELNGAQGRVVPSSI
jgi:hypothetical protein